MNMGLRILIMFSFIPQVALSQHSIYDTLKVNPNSIVFYSITQAESDTMTFEEKDEILDDFYYHSGNIIRKYKDDRRFTTVMLTAHRHYLLNTNGKDIYINRLEMNHIVGMIMVRDDVYEIFTGVDTDVGFDSTIHDFFKY